ncbi:MULTISPECIES: hypothetical protein [unclassified Rhizobium]|nr:MULTISPECIES: hypothetical protein [unclassified Rhizobium]
MAQQGYVSSPMEIEGRYKLRLTQSIAEAVKLLGSISCVSKTITRQELEERVLNCLPVAFYSNDIFDRISQKMIAHEVTKLKSVPSRKDQIATELAYF